MNIALIGHDGALGVELKTILSPYKIALLDSTSCDITNEDLVRQTLADLGVEIVINAAAYTNVEEAQSNRDHAFAVNAHGPRNLADACKELGATLVHFSTDYVFGGTKRDGYTEDDDPGTPVNVYGQSKLMGETFIRQTLEQHYIIRISSLFGPAGKSFVSVMLGLAEQHDELKVVGDQHMKPTYAPDVAQATKQLIEEKPAFGVYHFNAEVPAITGEPEGITWAQFAQDIFKTKHELDSSFNVPKVNPIKAVEWPSKAKRPMYSALKNTKFQAQREYHEALVEYLRSV